MLKYGNNEFRNLQQQVAKNQEDIELMNQINTNGISIIGYADSVDDLPRITDEIKGKGFLIGPTRPYTLYIAIDLAWTDCGEFPRAGQRGLQGLKGDRGFTGPKGSKITIDYNYPSNPSEGDVFIAITNKYVYQYEGSMWKFKFELRGSQGPQGNQGPEGPMGPEGPRGFQGPMGSPAVFNIRGKLSATNYLPNAGLSEPTDAYVIGTGIWVIVNGSWQNIGDVVNTDWVEGSTNPLFSRGLMVENSCGLMEQQQEAGYMFDDYGAPVICNGIDGTRTIGICDEYDPNGNVEWYTFPDGGGNLLTEDRGRELYLSKDPTESVLWTGSTQVSNGAENAGSFTRTQLTLAYTMSVGDRIRCYFSGPATSNSYHNGAGYVEFEIIQVNGSIAGGGCYMSINQYGPVIVGASVGQYGVTSTNKLDIGVYRCNSMYPSVNMLYITKVTRLV